MLKSWRESKTIQSLAAALMIHTLVWINMQLSVTPFTLANLDWKYLVGGVIAILVPVVKRLADPDIVSGVKLLDKDNY